MKRKEIIKLENVKKIYDDGTFALKGVSLTIYERDFISIFGPSGSGKSTLLHIMGLLDYPSSGKVYVDGIDVADMGDDAISKIRGHKIGFVFQSFNLINSCTSIENVMLPMLINDVDYEKAEKRAAELLRRVGLEEKIYTKVNKLSGGQQQRVAIARALSMNPKIIFADEPTGNLDTKTGHEIIKIFDELNKEGVTFVIVTHDPEIAEESDKIFNIHDGMIINHTDGRKIKKIRNRNLL
ncbi:MAG: ABC transporter ATP-binding protein [Candidatus Anstonellales archaeon]